MKPTLATTWRRLTVLLVLVTLLTSPMVPRAAAEDSTLIRISKSTIYGGLLGILLGSAVALVVDDNRDEPIRWGLVIGVFGGFAYGVYSASTGRDDFFQRTDGRIDPSQYLLPTSGTSEPAPVHSMATPLRIAAEGRSEFSPYAPHIAE